MTSNQLPRNPLIQTPLIRGLSKIIFALTGWRAVGAPPPLIQKYVMICAPHTSYWDGFWMLGCASLLGVDLRFLGKHTMFKGPLGWFMRGMGAVPVIRSERRNTVQQAAEWFRSSDAFLLGVAPEGTRKLTAGWKTGFYWIAREAGVPIACAFVDYGTKTGGFLADVIHPTGDIDQDFELFRNAYLKITPKFPEKMGPIQPLAQPGRDGGVGPA
ncbi:MAG: 1-acyl-sn-glycerol-3-phosphate acyltransferase [Vicinamibacteria bacterium]|nr:1-acyl-sn-glycerol-3-phosphate acyltransferase [Vicinamibacteria bacterium]